MTAKNAKRGRFTQKISFFGGRPMHDMFFKPGMSEDSFYQIGKEVDWWAADLAASYCSDLLIF